MSLKNQFFGKIKFMNKSIVVVIFFIAISLMAFQWISKEKASVSPEMNALVLPELEENEKGDQKEEKEGKETDNYIVRSDKDLEGQLVKYQFTIENVPSPKGVSFLPNGEEIWVTSLTNKRVGVYVFDSLTGRRKKEIHLPDGGGVEVIFNKEGDKAYVSQMETARIFEIDSINKEILRIFDTRSSWTKVLFLSSDEKRLYASNWVGDNVSEFNVETGKLLRNLPSVDTPRGLYIDEEELYIAGFGRGSLQKVNLETGSSEIVFESGGALRHIAGKEGILFISDMAKRKIWKLDTETGDLIDFAETENNPNTIVLSPDNKILFVSNRGENYSSSNYNIPGPEWGSVLLFDSDSGELLDVILGGNQPTGLDVSPDGKTLVFSNFLDHNLEIYQIPSYEELKEGNGGAAGSYEEELRKF